MPQRMVKALNDALRTRWIFGCRASKTPMALAAGLATLSVFCGGLAHAGTVYSWTKTMGGAGFDGGFSATVDSSGNVYVTGYFSGTVDFDPGAGTDNHTSAGF
ncbi:MAG: hypothetical protein GTO24_19135 [candidate division Zixibacteria bacterium]|nr:hypothetical protein [candidate division Zixibacteria bacterium]